MGDREAILTGKTDINLMEMFPKMLNVEEDSFQMTPSEYIKEMTLTMEERHKKLVRIANTTKTLIKNYPQHFIIVPNILVFQRFEGRSKNILVLEIKNVGKNMVPIKMHCPNSVYFSAGYKGVPINKLAPGLSVEYEVTFTPKDARDYYHFLLINSKDFTFEVPVIAIGPRPLLDIPDQIVLNSSPVKITTKKFILVRNIGNAPAIFNFLPQGQHFQVSPSKGVLTANESMLLCISFESLKVQEVTESVILVLETGEKLIVTMHGSAENVSVRLDKSTVTHEDTFIGMKRCKTIRLINNSSSIVKYSWKRNKSDKEAETYMKSLKEKYEELAELEILKNTKIIYSGLSDEERHKLSCERILQDEIRAIEREEFNFQHEAFSIVPQSGEVWPKTSVELMVLFEPKTNGLNTADAFLEVSGKDTRLPLKIKGTGLGPNIVMNLKTLDIDYIYLCSQHRYEVIAENKGDIPGTIEFLKEPLIFGGKVEVIPDARHLNPGQVGSFVISFTSNRQGDFTEKLSFGIRESKEKVVVIFKGKIVSPTLHFDIKQIDFGTIPVGFPKQQEVTLNNLSVVPVTFSLRVLSDGEIPSISCDQFAKFTVKPSLPLYPREFQIDPEESVVEPFSSKKVLVTITPNRTGHFQTHLVVDMWDSENGAITCPITFHSLIPTLVSEPEVINIPFCFINFPYTRSITLKNLSKVPGFFYIVPSDPIAESSMTCSASIPQGVVGGRDSIKIDITVITSALGRQQYPIDLLTFGNDNARELCKISCVGQGPVVTVRPSSLQWGDVELLENVEKTLVVANESPIPATVTLRFARQSTLWTVEPTSVTILSEKSVMVTVGIFLNDRGKFKETLKVNVYNGKTLMVPLTATGIGSSLKMTPKITPKYDFGTLFSQKKYEIEVVIENKGNKTHGLVWSPYADYRAFANAKFVIPSEFPFRISPVKIDIAPGEIKSIKLEAKSMDIGSFTQMFYCFASVGVPTKELHLTAEVFAEFVGPLVNFDKSELHFWYNLGSESTEEKLEDTVNVINLSVLSITIFLVTSLPFCVRQGTQEYAENIKVELEGFESKELNVKFIAEPNENKVSKSFKGSLFALFKDQSKMCSLDLRGEINYPNVLILPKNINFGYVPVGMSECINLHLVNISPLTVHYDIQWNIAASKLIYSQKPSISTKSIAPDSADSAGLTVESVTEDTEQDGEPLTGKTSADVGQNIAPPIKPVAKMPNLEILKSDVRASLFPLTRNYYNCDSELMHAYRTVRSIDVTEDVTTSYTRLFDIIPFYGKLEAYCGQTLQVKFHSNSPVKVQVGVTFNIKAGMSEQITLTAMSAAVDFQLSAVELDFEKQLFCETKSKVLRIQNTGAMPFVYEANAESDLVCEFNENFPLGRGVLTVSPKTGTVKPFEQTELVVRYHPGVPGKFVTDFQLQIAFLEPVRIKVKGYGVFPQVYLSLPRPEILKIPEEIGYQAVASLTPDWMLTAFASGTGMYDLNALKPYRSRESSLGYDSEDELSENWDIVKSYFYIPSEIDINLAIERILANNLVATDSSNNATFAVYARTIPSFNVPAYSLDFGICVIGRTVEHNVTVTNFGPLPVVIYGIFESHLKEEGIHIRLKNRNELKICASLSFIVVFNPRKSKFKEKYEKVQTMFYFEIYHGPKIPINISAVVTYPHVVASMEKLNFREVVCGYCKVINLKLHNPGYVTAHWSLLLKKTVEGGPRVPANAVSGKTVFHLSYTSGILSAGEYCSLQVSFKPEFESSFYAVLYIRVAESLDDLKILLLGNGIEPKLNISQRLLDFKSTLPYPNRIEKIFSVENPCAFPIEFYFQAFDEQSYDEEKVLRAVMLYYQTNEVLLPARRPGENLPVELTDFYQAVLDNLNAKFMEEEREKILAEREKDSVEENDSCHLSIEDGEPAFTSSQNLIEKKKKKQKKQSRSRTSNETVRPFTASIDNGREPYVPSIFEKKSSLEIDDLLQEYIATLWDKELAYDPVQAALQTVLPVDPPEEYTEGTLIIFYGAPFTNSVQLANRAAMFVNMLALNIDRIVLEEAALGRFEPGQGIKDLIEHAYMEYIDGDRGKSTCDKDWKDNDVADGEEVFDFDLEFEEIQRKFNALVTLRENILLGKGKSGQGTSAKSDGSRKPDKSGTPTAKAQMNVNAPIANISEEMVVEILKLRLALEVSEGLVIEGLQSVLINSPPKALISLLKAAGNLKDIIVVFLMSSYNQYSKYQLMLQAEQETAKFNFRESILQILEEEPEEVFESLSLNPEDADTIRQAFIEHRHELNVVHEKKKDIFYEFQRLKKAAIKKGQKMPSSPTFVQFESSSPTDKKDKDPKKKDTTKGTKTSEVSNRMTGSDGKSARPKKDALDGEFLSFEMDFIEMKAIIDSWDQRLGALIVDSGAEVKGKKNQTPRRSESTGTNKLKNARGVFLWLVDASNPENNSFASCCWYLRTCLLNRVQPSEAANWPLEVADAMTFSIATCPSPRDKIPLSPMFSISVTENVVEMRMMGEDLYEDAGEYIPAVQPVTQSKLNRSLSSISFKSKRKGSAASKRRRTDSRMGSDIKSFRSRKFSFTSPIDENQIQPRYILQPGEMRSFRVKYFPTETGQWQQIYDLKFVNWHNGDAVACVGVCDIPHVDMKPDIVFPSVEHSKPLITTFTPAYYYLEDFYDFGSIITLQSGEGKKIKKSVVLNLANHSTLPVDLCIIPDEEGSIDEAASENIKYEPDKFWLMPRESKPLLLTASPTKNGSILETLLLIVKDNPKVEKIRVKCEGVRPNVTVEPRMVNFDRLLLHRKDYRRAILTNNNTTPLYVVLKGVEHLPPQFTFLQKNGWIAPLGSLTIEILYEATEVQMIANQQVIVQVFDNNESDEVVQELPISLSVEAYDAALDIFFSTPEDDHIDFGDIRVDNSYSISFNLKNISKYQLGYRIDMDSAFFGELQNNTFYVTPSEGKLFPGKLFPVVANFVAQEEVSWRRIPLFKIMLVEPYLADELIASIPICVSARSHFSRYELKPSDEFNFGHIKIGSMTTRSILIENKGHFSLSYFIEFQSSVHSPEESAENVKRSSKLSASSKDKGKKSHGSFRNSPFSISPNSGNAESGQTATINVTCLPSDVKRYEEKIVIFVNECLPHLKRGSSITISAEGCLPIIQFDDIKTIFREHFICKTEAELSGRVKPGSYTVYTEDNNLFSFKNVCVNKTAEARLHLHNIGLIECNINASIKVAGEEEGSRTAGLADPRFFSLQSEKLVIEPYNSGFLVLSFRPEALEEYKAKLTVTLEMPESFKDEVRVYNLKGKGILPQIEITEPNSKLPEGQTLVNFPPTSVGNSSVTTIAFTNTGVLECRVIMELYKFQNSAFRILPKKSTEKLMKIWEMSKPIEHTAIVSFAPGEVAEFEVCFTPPEVQSYNSQIKLFIVDNPFENWSFKLVGEVFFEEVVIEKIRTTPPFLTESQNNEKLPPPVSPGQYFISFSECYVKKKSKILLRLSNKTEKDYFKFEWDEVQSISVSPLNGHLYPKSYKEILFTFHPEETMELEDVTIACMLNKIILSNPTEPSWDTRLVHYQSPNKPEIATSRSCDKKENSINQPCDSTVKVCGEEPEYDVVPESNKMLYVNVSGVADYAILTCETTKIIFKNTFMFQSRSFPLVLENPGKVAAEYKLTLKSITVWPLKAHKVAQVREQSLLGMSSGRPQSSMQFSDSNREFQLKPHSRCSSRPRPLTSMSILDLKNTSESEVRELSEQTEDEPKYINYNPFNIENVTGKIPAKEKTSCNLVFAPMDINEYKAVVSIRVANLHPDHCLPDIEITASSIMPYCHFDVPESDYLESGRRDYNRPGPIGCAPGIPLHPDTKTIETKVLGVGVTVPIKFHVINPTEDDYSFSWANVSQSQPEVVPSFHCSTVDGVIRAGRQQLMMFNFVSQKVGIAESFWKFSVPKYNVETPFLFVCDVRQPAVYFLSNHVNLRPTFIGSSSSDLITLLNNEDVALDFNFLHESLYSEGKLNCLKMEPSSGKLLPNSETKIRVTFTGKTAGKTAFSVKCKVKTFKEPFVVSVEAVTYAIQPLVTFEDVKKVKTFPDVDRINVIDFGSELNLNIPETITFSFTSLSKTSFYYDWEYNKEMLDARHCKLKFSAKSGHVLSFSRAKCDITIVFSKKSSLVNFPLKLKIRRGPTFRFSIQASASIPPFELSFSEYDFGYCFLQEKDVCFSEVPLFIKNKDSVDLFLECAPPNSTAFSYSLPVAIVPPGEDVTVFVGFHPKDCVPYEDVIKFTINGIYQKIVHLKGHGTEFKVGLVNPEDTTISLGAVKMGKTSTREFSLVNKSLSTASLLLGFGDQVPVRGRHLAWPRVYPLDLTVDHRLEGILKLSPSEVFRIKPQEVFAVRVTYTPKHRSSPFSETVYLQHQEKAEPLCMLTGCCLGPEISLDRNFLNFGAVVQSCTSTMRLKLVNSGSIGARFEWDTKKLKNYEISPASGYCSPESDVTIQVTFVPSVVENCIKNSVECVLTLPDNEEYPSLLLDLMGDCVAFPEPAQTLVFECLVRESDTKTVEIENPSGTDWQLLPLVSGEYYRGFDALIVPALSSSQYEITYNPLTMTQSKSFHEGSVFFRLPNGRGLLYKLSGTSFPPDPEEVIEREVPCKTKYVELLKVRNWLQSPQRFKVNISCIDNLDDPGCSCYGFEKMEVPALAQKEYGLNFFAYNVGYLKFHVSFVNEETREYVWYDISFHVVMCGSLETITLKSGVRQTCYHELKLENPLKTTIQFRLETTSPDIMFENSVCEVPPMQTMYTNLSYTPIHPGEKIEKLTVACLELGVFPRELKLIAMEVLPEPPRTFDASLGSSQTQKFIVKNFSSSSAVLRCKTNSPEFTVSEQANVAAGESIGIEVTYEPSEIGSSTGTLFVESEQAGNFVFLLMGICGKPLAKGPYIVKAGSGVTIPFKNVFNKAKEFHMYVDHPAFYLKSSEETVCPKEETKICVGFQRTKCIERLPEYKETDIDPKFPVTGQLVVESFNPYVKWQFYLKGVLDK